MTLIRSFAMALALLGGALLPAPALAQSPAESAAFVELPFKVTSMRGPGSEVALAVSTSGLLPIARPKPASADPKAPVPVDLEPAQIVVVWGEEGGAVIGLVDGTLRTTLLGAEAVEGLAETEKPRGGVPGSRRALDGPLSAYLSGPTRGPHAQPGQAAGLTIRERQPVGVSAEPKPVPINTVTVTPGPDATFAGPSPRIATVDNQRVVLAVTVDSREASSLAIVAKNAEGRWTISARTPPQPGKSVDGPALSVAAVGDFTGSGRPQIALIHAPDGKGALQVWSYDNGTITLLDEKAGFAGPSQGDAVLSTAIANQPGTPSDLAVPLSDRGTLAILSLRGGIREISRTPLPAAASLGIAALGRGSDARLLVGLADGRIAVVPAQRGTSR